MPVMILKPSGRSQGPNGFGICARPVSAASTRSGGSRSPNSVIFGKPRPPTSKRPKTARTHRGLRFEQAERFSPPEPFWGSSKPSTSSEGVAIKEMKEVVPVEVKEKVLSTAGGGAMVIEMLWSNSSYLPAHDKGRKYLATAKELSELMEGRMSYGRHVPVLTIEKPVAIQKV